MTVVLTVNPAKYSCNSLAAARSHSYGEDSSDDDLQDGVKLEDWTGEHSWRWLLLGSSPLFVGVLLRKRVRDALIMLRLTGSRLLAKLVSGSSQPSRRTSQCDRKSIAVDMVKGE